MGKCTRTLTLFFSLSLTNILITPTLRYILYRYHKKSATHEEYMLALQADLLQSDVEPQKDTHTHQFAKNRFRLKQPRCKWCTLFYTAKGARNTWWYCIECEVPLCQDGGCFDNFHDSTKVETARNTKIDVKLGRIKRKRTD